MFRRIADFQKTWSVERDATLKVLKVLQDGSLDQSVTAEGRTLGRLAWHLTQTLSEMVPRTGLVVPEPPAEAPVPESAAAIVEAYEKASARVAEEVASRWTDDTLEVEDEMYGERWPRGQTLLALVTHQAHHRGQMTVLMRQAGLKVPGIYGPAREEWTAYGMSPPEV